MTGERWQPGDATGPGGGAPRPLARLGRQWGTRLAATGGCVVYYALDVAIRTIDLPSDRSIAWFPPAGIGLAALTLAGPRWAPLLAATRFAAGLAPRRFHAPWWAVLGEALLVAAVYAAAAAVVRRNVALDGRGWRVRDAAWLTGAVVAATAASALYAGTQLVVWRGFPWSALAGQSAAWWAADSIGALVVLPLALFVVAPWLAPSLDPAAALHGSPDEAPGHVDRVVRAGELVAQGVAVAIACALVLVMRREEEMFGPFSGYVCFVPLTWVALRSGVRGAVIVATTYAAAATLLVGVFGASGREVLELQFLLLTLSSVGLFLGAARTAATEGEARYWHLLASANEGVWRADRDWRTVYVNRRLADMLGTTPAGMAGRHVLDFMQPESVERARRRFANAGAGVAETYEIALRHADGSRIHALVHGSPVYSATTGTVLGAVALVTDVTALRDAEAARRRSDDLLETAFRTSRDAMALVRADDGVIVDVNDRWCELTGLDREALVGSPSSASGAGWGGIEDASRLVAAMREHGSVRDIETALRRRTGGSDRPPDDEPVDVRHVVLTAHPSEADGRTYYLVTARDVTAERRAAQRRGQLQRLEELGRLAGGVAHDFNNLLTVIGSYAELAEEDVLAGRHTAPADMREIRRGVERGRDLTRRLLAFSRHQAVEPRRVDTAAALRDAGGLLRSVLGSRVALSVRLGEPLPAIMADPGQLDQVLLNLAANARDAMPDGGRFTLDARVVRVAPGEAAGVVGPDALPGDYVVLAATDTGSGMTEATQARIFEPFYTTKASGEGTGLGLAVVFGIVRQAHGAIRVDSAPGRGSTFTVFWPAAPAGSDAPAAAPATAPSAAAAPAARGTLHVLLVDDEDAVRSAARRMLERAGITVAVARNGAEALTLVERMPAPPDVVVSDVAMPVLGGRELAARLAETHPALPVLLMSGYVEAESGGSVRDGLPNVCAPLIEKPFTADALVAAVRRAAEGTSAS